MLQSYAVVKDSVKGLVFTATGDEVSHKAEYKVELHCTDLLTPQGHDLILYDDKTKTQFLVYSVDFETFYKENAQIWKHNNYLKTK